MLHRLFLHGECDRHGDDQSDHRESGYDDDHERHVSVVYVYCLLVSFVQNSLFLLDRY